MRRSPAYQRARIALLRSWIARDSKAPEVPLLRNGVLPPQADAAALIRKRMQEEPFPHHELSFTELCTFNTFFDMHPDKVCGTEVVTTSREFPLTIRGDKKTIQQTIRAAISAPQPDNDTIELQALALELELQLLHL